ncbi:MAG: winged helix-turn-helix transcriptional regulator [Clostridiaceae bacterium]|jgi:DNA-binding transcriptional ArsR family regulator|nr:metalloregulator ArsR/SmtB family transcription factor [Bacillota bacterium]NLI39038.1 winged helix-turn-helix transcriptional regulator [Clostridiaceae bacterium]
MEFVDENRQSTDQPVMDKELVENVRQKMPDEELLYDLAEFFKVFGDSTRIKIIWALFEADMCVCDIAKLLNMSQSAISHQLRVLKNSRLVRYKKSGKTVYYSLNDDHIERIFELGMEHIME